MATVADQISAVVRSHSLNVPDVEGKQPLWTQVQDAGLTAFAGAFFEPGLVPIGWVDQLRALSDSTDPV